MTLQLAILGSTRGSNLPPIIEAINHGSLDAKINIVLSNKADTGILEKARTANLNAVHLPVDGRDREAYDRAVDQVLNEQNIDLIVMIGYMRIVSAWFVKKWQGKMINVHPSLLPKYKGLMNLAVHQAVLDNDERETGCSVHLVEEEVDGGDVLVQKSCQVLTTDTAESLKTKVQALEAPALIEAITHYKTTNSCSDASHSLST